ncbi:hypothetical protein E2C01_043452 [Portunus trituberculatus]|uniref:Uncharacterized protein n=1 Tax=Portunus trituberculatus TaxID=210409 RepID=A0A5B7FXD5_PORTR|nr:hypothetical protein [Portunus trituberculatus]
MTRSHQLQCLSSVLVIFLEWKQGTEAQPSPNSKLPSPIHAPQRTLGPAHSVLGSISHHMSSLPVFHCSSSKRQMEDSDHCETYHQAKTEYQPAPHVYFKMWMMGQPHDRHSHEQLRDSTFR